MSKILKTYTLILCLGFQALVPAQKAQASGYEDKAEVLLFIFAVYNNFLSFQQSTTTTSTPSVVEVEENMMSDEEFETLDLNLFSNQVQAAVQAIRSSDTLENYQTLISAINSELEKTSEEEEKKKDRLTKLLAFAQSKNSTKITSQVFSYGLLCGDLQKHILSFLDHPSDLLNFRLVNKEARDCVNDLCRTQRQYGNGFLSLEKPLKIKSSSNNEIEVYLPRSAKDLAIHSPKDLIEIFLKKASQVVKSRKSCELIFQDLKNIHDEILDLKLIENLPKEQGNLEKLGSFLVDYYHWIKVSGRVSGQISRHSEVRGQVGSALWTQLWYQVEYQVGDQVRDQVGVQIRDQVGNQVRDQVRAQIRARVRTASPVSLSAIRFSSAEALRPAIRYSFLLHQFAGIIFRYSSSYRTLRNDIVSIFTNNGITEERAGEILSALSQNFPTHEDPLIATELLMLRRHLN